MFQDYKVAYSEKGSQDEAEEQSTVTVGRLLRHIIFLLPCDSSEFSAAFHEPISIGIL
jgi:hypothetical protein